MGHSLDIYRERYHWKHAINLEQIYKVTLLHAVGGCGVVFCNVPAISIYLWYGERDLPFFANLISKVIGCLATKTVVVVFHIPGKKEKKCQKIGNKSL
jgi:hypothetical protein